MQLPFFPGPVFGWMFYLTLTGFLGLAAIVDWRTLVVPKQLSLGLLGLGLLVSLVRGAWLGAQGEEVWSFGRHGAWIGAADGLAFGFAGALLGFGIFFCLWTAGICGGGDVKLFTAVGAWVGPYLAVFILIGTILAVLVWTLALVVLAIPMLVVRLTVARVAPGLLLVMRPARPAGARKLYLTYSLPVALATALVLPWVLRADLHLAVPGSRPVDRVEAHVQ